jgi:hypothetical protein
MTLVNPDRSNHEIIEQALSQLSPMATREERVRAIQKARDAWEELSPEATELEELQAAREAVASVAEEVKRRTRVERYTRYPWLYLPTGRLDKDEKEAQEIIADVVAQMPTDAPDYKVQTEIEKALKQLCQKIERRNCRKKLVEHGRLHVYSALRELDQQGALQDPIVDLSERQRFERAVERELQETLTGTESQDEVEELVMDILAEELDLEPEEDQDEELDDEEEEDY